MDRLSYNLCDGPGVARALREIDNLEAERQVIRDRMKMLAAVIEADGPDADKAAEEYDALADASSKLTDKINELENTKGMP